MHQETKELLNKLKYQAEKLDNRYKAMIDICNEIENIGETLQYDIHKLEKEL